MSEFSYKLITKMDNSTNMLEWDANTPHADKFAFRGNFVTKVYGAGYYHQLKAKDPLSKGSTLIKATIKKYPRK